ncbi:MAG: transcriptional regulator [Halanaeroarchaeum sp.]
MENTRTTRERIADRLREGPATVSELAAAFSTGRSATLRHLRHVARSVHGTAEEFLVRPPRCRNCGFEDFDDPLNVPSRCPQCKNEGIEEPAFRIE